MGGLGGTTFYRQMWRFCERSAAGGVEQTLGSICRWNPQRNLLTRVSLNEPATDAPSFTLLTRRVRVFHAAPRTHARTQVSTVMWHSRGRVDTIRVIPSFSGIASVFLKFFLKNLLKFRRLGLDKPGCHGNQILGFDEQQLLGSLFAPSLSDSVLLWVAHALLSLPRGST